jgi:hypothetical protein
VLTIEDWDHSQERKAGDIFQVTSSSGGDPHLVINLRCTICAYIMPMVMGYGKNYTCPFCGGEEPDDDA